MFFKRGIFVSTLLFFWFLTSTVSQAEACQAQEVPYLNKRARNYVASDNAQDPYVNDYFLGIVWYSVSDRRMPDQNTIPDNTTCGTEIPIYINGNHPDLEDLANGTTLGVTVCELYPFDVCLNQLSITIRLCEGQFQYLLKPTSIQAAYCFDPPELWNITNFDPAPDISVIENLTLKPRLNFNLKNNKSLLPKNEYLCLESPEKDRSLDDFLYSTYWYADSTIIAAYEEQPDIVTFITDDTLISENVQFGINLRCGVRISKTRRGLKSEERLSNSYYFGVNVSSTVVSLRVNETAKITLRPTIPYGCYADKDAKRKPWTPACSIGVVFNTPVEQCRITRDTITGFSLAQLQYTETSCGTSFEGFYPFDVVGDGSELEMKEATIELTSLYLSSDDSNLFHLTLMVKGSGTHEIWKNQTLPTITVNTVIDENVRLHSVCYSRVDPHVYTFDGRALENQEPAGEFILYRHDEYPIEVQERTTPCNGGRAYCACAVGVRSGGDVFLINLCGDLKFIGMTSCKDGGNLVIQKYDDYQYQIQTNIGTLIIVTIQTGNYKNLMNVQINPSPKDFGKTKGICGIYDGNTKNDYHNRDGGSVNTPYDFKESWRLTYEDINLLRITCQSPVSKWDDIIKAKFCMCNCTLNRLQNKEVICPADGNIAICSTSQYINCEIDSYETTYMCKRYQTRCSSVQTPTGRRKRNSFLVDPEVEMRRKSDLSETPSRITFKRNVRTTRDDLNITMDLAYEICAEAINQSYISQQTNLTTGLNLTLLIEECAFDVFVGQDLGWTSPMVGAVNDGIRAVYKRNANYTLSHLDEVEEFKSQSCPLNCSGHGLCNKEGICECETGWFGADCDNDVTQGPVIEDTEADGLCDLKYGGDCQCFGFQASALQNNFTCKRLQQKRFLNGTLQHLTEEYVQGDRENIYNGMCCFENEESDGRRKRDVESEDVVDVYIYEDIVAISNDGDNFGANESLFIFDSTCINITKDLSGGSTFMLKENTCQIQGFCYVLNDFLGSDSCNKCKPAVSQISWTFDCNDNYNDDEKSKSTSLLLVAIFIPLSIVIFLPLCLAICCRLNSRQRTQSFVDIRTTRDMQVAPNLRHTDQQPLRFDRRMFITEKTQ